MSTISLFRALTALVAGLLFGFGLSVSGMVDPARVLGFLDIASGNWDPSLMFVLGGAVATAVPGMLIQRRLAKPALGDAFDLPERDGINQRLLIGSVIFGIGWGIAGFCPGPAVAGLSIGMWGIVVFVVAMCAGMIVHDRLVSAGHDSLAIGETE
ncbi:MAG: YeeE/YedE family protein [Rhizobiaceae bacterium]|nr:YeeE/YedE family protein [Rhizobiaceae bacterium]